MTDTTEPMTSLYGPIITQLRQNNYRALQANRDFIRGVSTPVQAAREYRTVHIGGARQTGLSSWIAQNVHERMLIVSYNEAIRAMLMANAPKQAPFNPYRQQIWQHYTALEVRLKEWRPDSPPNTFTEVVVDSASYVFEKIKQSALYRWALEHTAPDPEFILLG